MSDFNEREYEDECICLIQDGARVGFVNMVIIFGFYEG
jgi:hypothetical protein